MDIEQIRDYCLSKLYATEDMTFGQEYVVFRIGGKIFCGLALEPQHPHKATAYAFDRQ